MPRWKETSSILRLKNDGEIFDPNWWDQPLVHAPPTYVWGEKRPPRIEEIDIWEVICERSGLSGVYAAWCPYAEVYIVTNKWNIVAEFSGLNANARLEKYLIAHDIPYPAE